MLGMIEILVFEFRICGLVELLIMQMQILEFLVLRLENIFLDLLLEYFIFVFLDLLNGVKI